jgi:hypothetical protein
MTTDQPVAIQCGDLQHWNHAICKKKRRKWWGFVATILFLILFCWTIVVVYLLTPPAKSIVNRQVLLKDPYGQTQVCVIQQGGEKGFHPKIVSKQSVVSLYNLQNRRQQAETISLLPTICEAKHYYLISYEEENQTFYRNVLDVKKGELRRSHHYPSSFYFLKETFNWLSHRRDDQHSHWVSEL